jgi:DNA-binding NarL/FixJ family response regulator
VNESKFGNVRTLLAVDNPLLRKGLYEAFKHAGFAMLEDASAPETLGNALSEASFDLIIMAADMQGVFVCHLISELRNGRLGQHPFAVAIVLLPVAHNDYVRKVIDCGPDDMLLMPVSPSQLLSRVEVLARTRKPFVVTQDFVGPDRRQEKRPGPSAPMFDVPNPLSAKVNNMSAEMLEAQIAMATKRLNSHKLERYIVQISWLNDAIANQVNRGQVDQAFVQGHVARLLQIADDLPLRTSGALVAGSPLVLGLRASAKAVIGTNPEAASSHLAGLAKSVSTVSKEIRRLLTEQASARTAARQGYPIPVTVPADVPLPGA